MDGRFESNTIVVDLEISSPLASDTFKSKLPFGVDTGFTGDLCMTYQEAFPLALSLVGVSDYTVADGSKVAFFECIGIVTIDGRSVPATISIRPNGSKLMGVSLMKRLGIKLDIDFTNQKVVFSQSPKLPSSPTVTSPIKTKVPALKQ